MLNASLEFAVDSVRRRNPDLDVTALCAVLRAKNWVIEESEIAQYVAGPDPHESVPAVSVEAVDERAPSASLPAGFAAALERLRAQSPPAVAPPRAGVSTAWEEASREILDALTAEIAAASAQQSKSRVDLRAGCLLGVSTGGFTARWELVSDAPVDDGTRVKLRLGAHEVDAEVIHLHGSSITLYVSSSQPATITEATMLMDASYLLERRRDYIRDVRLGKAPFDSGAALSFREAPAVDVVPAAWAGSAGLSEEQQIFVHRALAGGTTWLWGPPGTGKTTTLTALLHELVSRGQRTLFVSNTNAAVDTALLKFLDGRTSSQVGEVVRIGPPSMPTVSSHEHGPVLVDTIAAAQGLEIATHLAECRRAMGRLKRENHRLVTICRDPVGARDKGLLGDPEDDLFDLKKRIFDEDIESQRDRCQAAIGATTEQRRALERAVDAVRDAVISRGRLVFATVHQTYLTSLREQRFDVVVIDEASMVSSDLVAMAAAKGSGWTVIAGDFRQLSPISLSEAAPARRWLRASPFEHAGVRAKVTTGRTPSNLVALKTQHRMRPGIQAVVGDGFYGELGLVAGPSIATRPADLPTNIDHELVLIDTSSLRPWMTRQNGRGSKLNVIHAQIVEWIAGTVDGGSSFGAVSPFAPQSRLLQSLADARSGHAASTVHRFQGGERDVMVWDMTEGRAGQTRVNPWFDAATADEEGARLLNVALSRARDQLFVIADVDRVRAGCRDTSIVRRTLSRIGTVGLSVDALDLFESPSAGRTTTHRGDDPLASLLRQGAPWVVAWCADPPRRLPPTVWSALQSYVDGGGRVYIRTGVPDRDSQREVLLRLMAVGCDVQLVRPCRENLLITATSVVASCGSLLEVGIEQSWLRTESTEFAGAVLRMVSRRGDANVSILERDEVCPKGHPLLVDHAHEQDFRGRCLWCRGDVTANVRTGRTRSKGAATARPICRSCGEIFGDGGWCSC